MAMTDREYSAMVKKASPNSKTILNMLKAFLVGGIICLTGQCLTALYTSLGLNETDVKIAVPCSLIVLSALLTAIGVYDDIAAFGGAGALVPITGFANAVVAPAQEFKSEGYVLGTGAKIFTIAGPVIVYGTITAVLYGIILAIIGV